MSLKIKISLEFFLFFFLSFLFLMPVSAAAFTLSGNVKDSTNNVIAGGIVDIKDNTNNEIGNTTTDSLGNYNISNINTGVYNITLTPPSNSSYTPVVASSYSITTDTTLNFILVPTGTILVSGHIYDPLGNGVANQTVSLTGGTTVSTTTGSDGSYSLQVAPGTYTLEVSSRSNPLSVSVPEVYSLDTTRSLTQSTIWNITIPVKKVTVHIQDSLGNGISGVSLLSLISNGAITNLDLGSGLTNIHGSSGYGIIGTPQPITDQSGNLVMWLFPTGGTSASYSFTATPPNGSGYLPTTTSGITFSGDTQKIITLQQPISLSGHIYDPLGNPLANQTVSLSSNSTVSTTTGLDGSYSLRVAPGTYTFEISSRSNPLTINAPEVYDLQSLNSLTQNTVWNITIPAKKVSVHVQDSLGNAVSNVALFALISSGSIGQLDLGSGITSYLASSGYGIIGTQQPTTDQAGNVVVWLFPNSGSSAKYSFTATPPNINGYLVTTVPNISFSNDTQETITLLQQLITISGHIYDPLGNGVANQTVSLTGGTTVSTTTGSDGSYSLQVAPGTYTFTLSSRGNSLNINVPEVYSLDFSRSLTQNTIWDITIPAKKVTVHVQDVLGNGVSGVSLLSLITNGSITNLDLGSGITGVHGSSGYGQLGTIQPTTDQLGSVVLWLFPTGGTSALYSMTATPPIGYSQFALNNISITGDQTELISLQFAHAQPVTTATLSPAPYPDGTYPNPVTGTLSAAAASGYTIANTYYTVDGGTQQTYSAPFTVSGDGNHTITYWSIDNAGVYEAPNTKTFTIHANLAPQIGSLTDTTINEGDTYSTTGSFTDVDSTSWTGTVDYGDGSGVQNLPIDQANHSFTLNHLYVDNGTYTVIVSITDNQGASSSVQSSVIVNNLIPQVGLIDAPDVALVNTPVSLSVNFSDAGVMDSHTATIDWGDTTTSVGSISETNGSGSVTGTHTYTTGGTYNMVVTVTDNDGASGQSPAHQILINTSPTAHANGPYTVAEGSDVQLNGTATDDQTNLTYAWDLDNNGTFETPGQTVSFHGIDGPATQTVGVQVCDPYGACGIDTATITITNVAPSVDSVTVSSSTLAINTAMTASSTFTDPGILDTHTASIDWGDGITSLGSITETNGSGSVTGTHTYVTTGVFKMRITVSDNNGGQGMNFYQYIAVYDASAGFVTGSGSIISPQGAEPQFPTLTGTATFGINAKYTSGQTTPTGQVMFSFPNGGFDFASTSYDYLVVSGNTAYLSGQGTINGGGSYTFLVSVVDGQPDTFRMRIADNTTNTIIYDNQPGAADNIPATEAIAHGQIKVH